MAYDIKRAKERHKAYEAEKNLWNNHWQLVAEYVLQRKATFTSFSEPGAFIHSDIWDDTAGKAAETSASALLGVVWPDSRSFKIEAAVEELKDDDEVDKWFSWATGQIQDAMDDPDAGLSLALDEFALDYMVFGTPAIHVEEGETTDFIFDSWNVSQFCIEEGRNGYVDTVYRVFKITLRQAADRFGLTALSKKSQDAYKKGKTTDKIKILHIIEPRKTRGKSEGKKNLPVASVYIELDADHVISEGGYHEMPTFVSRFAKRVNEKYGRSPAMSALPSIMELNTVWESVTIAMEKNLDPPLAVYDSGVLGGGTIDTSAGAINVLNIGSKFPQGRNPIEPLYTNGGIGDVAPLIERLESSISEFFYIDRLLDMNNETQMTAREALIRDSMRTGSLRSLINRLYSEVFNRIISRCFNMMFRAGKLGYVKNSPEYQAAMLMNPGKKLKLIPEKITKLQGSGDRVYTIKYMTPAARRLQAEQAQGIINLYDFKNANGEANPTMGDNMNDDRAFRILGDVWGVPEDIYNSDEEKAAIRKGRAAQAQQQGALEAGAAQASIAKDAAMTENIKASATTNNL